MFSWTNDPRVPSISVVDGQSELDGLYDTVAGAAALEAIIFALQRTDYLADQLFKETTDHLVEASSTSANLTVFPVVSEAQRLENGLFSHSFGTYILPLVASTSTFTNAAPGDYRDGGQARDYLASFVETPIGSYSEGDGVPSWQLDVEGELPTSQETIKLTRSRTRVVIEDECGSASVAVPFEHLVIFTTTPRGYTLSHGLPFGEITSYDKEMLWWPPNDLYVETDSPGFQVVVISGVVEFLGDEPCFKGNVHDATLLAGLNATYLLIQAAIERKVKETIMENFTTQQLLAAALPVYNSRTLASLTSSALVASFTELEGEAKFWYGQHNDNWVHGYLDSNLDWGGGDRVRNASIKIANKAHPVGSVPTHDKTVVTDNGVTATMWLADGDLNNLLNADGEAGSVQWIGEQAYGKEPYLECRVANYQTPLFVPHNLYVNITADAVVDAGAKCQITVERDGHVTIYKPEVTAEDGELRVKFMVDVARVNFDISDLHRSSTRPSTGTNVENGPNNEYLWDGRLKVEYGKYTNYLGSFAMARVPADQTIINRLDIARDELFDPNNDILPTRVKIQFSRVAPIMLSPRRVDVGEEQLWASALISAIKTGYMDYRLDTQEQQIEALIQATEPSVFGVIAAGAYTISNFMVPGAGMAAALVVGTIGDIADNAIRNHDFMSAITGIALGLVGISQARRSGAGVRLVDNILSKPQKFLRSIGTGAARWIKVRNFSWFKNNSPRLNSRIQGGPVGENLLATDFMSLNSLQLTPISIPNSGDVTGPLRPLADRLVAEGIYPEHQSITINFTVPRDADDSLHGGYFGLGVSDGVQRYVGSFPAAGSSASFPSEPGFTFFLHKTEKKDGAVKTRWMSVSEIGGDDQDLALEKRALLLCRGMPPGPLAKLSDAQVSQLWSDPTIKKLALKTTGTADSVPYAVSPHSVASIAQSFSEAAGRDSWRYDLLRHNCQHFAKSAWKTITTGNPTGTAGPWFDRYIKEPAGSVLSDDELLFVATDIYKSVLASAYPDSPPQALYLLRGKARRTCRSKRRLMKKMRTVHVKPLLYVKEARQQHKSWPILLHQPTLADHLLAL